MDQTYIFKMMPIIGVILIGMITVVLLTKFLNIYAKEKTKKRDFQNEKIRIFQLLENKFSLGLVEGVEDIEILLNIFNRKFEGDLDFRNLNLSQFLEEYLTFIIENSKEEKQELLKKVHVFLMPILKKEKEKRPFADVPEEERRLLFNMKEAIDQDNKQSASFNLNELATLVTVRNKIYKKSERINKLALPIAIIGIIVSLIFGAMNIISATSKNYIRETIKSAFTEQVKEKPTGK